MSDCPICLESLEFQGLVVHTTECNHCFHVKCFQRLSVIANPTCPCCRAVVARIGLTVDAKTVRHLKRLKKDEKRESNLFCKMSEDLSVSAFDKCIQRSVLMGIRCQIEKLSITQFHE